MLIIRPGFAPSVLLYFYTQHSILKPVRINNATGASAKSKKVRDVSKGGGVSSEERPYDVSRGLNGYVTLP